MTADDLLIASIVLGAGGILAIAYSFIGEDEPPRTAPRRRQDRRTPVANNDQTAPETDPFRKEQPMSRDTLYALIPGAVLLVTVLIVFGWKWLDDYLSAPEYTPLPAEHVDDAHIPEVLTEVGRPTGPGVGTVNECERAIHEYYLELRERYHQLNVFGTTEGALQPFLLIIDEADGMVERPNAYQASVDDNLDPLWREFLGIDPPATS